MIDQVERQYLIDIAQLQARGKWSEAEKVREDLRRYLTSKRDKLAEEFDREQD